MPRLLRSLRGIARLLPNELRLPYPGADLHWAVYRKVRPSNAR